MSSKKLNRTPRRKRMNRQVRLQSGKNWIVNYTGSHVVRSYMKWYGVDLLCAITELPILGIKLDQSYVTQMLLAKEKSIASRKMKKAALDEQIAYEREYDFIVGYTSAGFPYGLTGEEINEY